VTFTSDVAPYIDEDRILNGGHAAIAYPPLFLISISFHEAMENSLVRDFLAKLTREEIIPTVPPAAQHDLEQYRQLIARRSPIRRLATPFLGFASMAPTGSQVHPADRGDRLKAGRSVKSLALFPPLVRYCYGERKAAKRLRPRELGRCRRRKTRKGGARKFLEMRAFRELSQMSFCQRIFDALWHCGARVRPRLGILVLILGCRLEPSRQSRETVSPIFGLAKRRAISWRYARDRVGRRRNGRNDLLSRQLARKSRTSEFSIAS